MSDLAAKHAAIDSVQRWSFNYQNEEEEKDPEGEWVKLADVIRALRPSLPAT